MISGKFNQMFIQRSCTLGELSGGILKNKYEYQYRFMAQIMEQESKRDISQMSPLQNII